MRISDWSSDVCSSDLLDGDALADRLAQVDDEDREPLALLLHLVLRRGAREQQQEIAVLGAARPHLLAAHDIVVALAPGHGQKRSEEHTSELQSLMRISYAVFCLKKKHNRK